MANELKMKHVTVSLIYMVLQLFISLIAIYVVPDNIVVHWIYLVFVAMIFASAYIVFMKKYYPLHEAYLKEIQPKNEEVKGKEKAHE
jgi:phosphotransferase system  glucose/maltose/N-acetylglucosamine-specific IIC component